MSDLRSLEDWASGLIASLDGQSRRALAREIAKELRDRQAKRIGEQLNPDGTPYAPRKPRLRRNGGAIRRKAMFAKLRTAKYLKVEASPAAATLVFAGAVQRMAQVHQYGLRDRVSRKSSSPEIQYQTRELLGIAAADRDLLADIILKHLSA